MNSTGLRPWSGHREQGVLPHQALGEASPGVPSCPLLLGEDCPWQLSAGTPGSPARGRVLLQRCELAPAARLQGREMLVGLWPDRQAQAAQPPALRLGVAVAGRFSQPCLCVRLCPPERPMPAPRAERTDREGLEREEGPQHANVGASGDMDSIPGLKRFPGEGNENQLRFSCLGNPMDRGAWQATVHRGEKESDTT